MAFGTPFSIAYVDPLEWVHTRFSKRLLRGILGCGIVLGLTFLIEEFVPLGDQASIYIIHRAFPILLFSLFIYGLFPLLCQKIGLVDPDVSDEQNDLMEQMKSAVPIEEIEANKKKPPTRLLGD
jgi:hypothetical protein